MITTCSNSNRNYTNEKAAMRTFLEQRRRLGKEPGGDGLWTMEEMTSSQYSVADQPLFLNSQRYDCVQRFEDNPEFVTREPCTSE